MEGGIRLDLKDERLQTSIWQQLLSHINPPFLPPLQALLLNPPHRTHRITFSPADWVEQGVEGAQNWTSTVSFLHKNPSSPSSCSLPEGRNSSSIFSPPAPLIFLLQDRSSFPRNLLIPNGNTKKIVFFLGIIPKLVGPPPLSLVLRHLGIKMWILAKKVGVSSRLEICRDRRDWWSCKIFVSCVNFSRKQRSFLHILQV